MDDGDGALAHGECVLCTAGGRSSQGRADTSFGERMIVGRRLRRDLCGLGGRVGGDCGLGLRFEAEDGSFATGESGSTS